MNLIYKIANSVSFRLKSWVDRKTKNNAPPLYPDCRATIQVIAKFHQCRRLCDIGANKGQWSYVMRQINAKLEEVVMFEPQAKFVQQLHELDLPGTRKHIYQCALGDQVQKLAISGGTASASLLEVSDQQHQYFPGSVNQESELVEVRILDEVYKNNNLDYPDLIKLDVQGYELNVLKGALEVLKNARYLVIELGLREFYKGQPPMWELMKFLEEQKFVMVDHGYELRSRTGPHELLQFDGIFRNTRFEGQ